MSDGILRSVRASVFGASGFFGSHVVEQLLEVGHSARALIRPSSDRSFLDTLDVEVRAIDFSDASLVDAMRGNDDVYNCTADTRLHLDEVTRRAVEVELTQEIIRAAAEAQVKLYVQLSTIQVYGPLSNVAVDEERACRPKQQYQRASLEREDLVREEAERAGIAWVIARPVTTTGARDTSLMANLYPAHQGGVFPLFGKGEQRVSMVDARDVGSAMVVLGEAAEAVGR